MADTIDEAGEDNLTKESEHLMESVIDSNVPLLVDIGEGSSWLEAH